MGLEGYSKEAAESEAEEIKKRVDYGMAEGYQEASDQVDAANAEFLRKELMALQEAPEPEERFTLDEIQEFLGQEEEGDPSKDLDLKTEDSIYSVREHVEDK